jgi:hypothetical protein
MPFCQENYARNGRSCDARAPRLHETAARAMHFRDRGPAGRKNLHKNRRLSSCHTLIMHNKSETRGMGRFLHVTSASFMHGLAPRISRRPVSCILDAPKILMGAQDPVERTLGCAGCRRATSWRSRSSPILHRRTPCRHNLRRKAPNTPTIPILRRRRDRR